MKSRCLKNLFKAVRTHVAARNSFEMIGTLHQFCYYRLHFPFCNAKAQRTFRLNAYYINFTLYFLKPRDSKLLLDIGQSLPDHKLACGSSIINQRQL